MTNGVWAGVGDSERRDRGVDALRQRHVLVLEVVGLTRGDEAEDLLRLGGHRTLCAAGVRGLRAVDHAGLPLDPLHHLFGVAQMGDDARMGEVGDLDHGKAGVATAGRPSRPSHRCRPIDESSGGRLRARDVDDGDGIRAGSAADAPVTRRSPASSSSVKPSSSIRIAGCSSRASARRAAPRPGVADNLPTTFWKRTGPSSSSSSTVTMFSRAAKCSSAKICSMLLTGAAAASHATKRSINCVKGEASHRCAERRIQLLVVQHPFAVRRRSADPSAISGTSSASHMRSNVDCEAPAIATYLPSFVR